MRLCQDCGDLISRVRAIRCGPCWRRNKREARKERERRGPTVHEPRACVICGATFTPRSILSINCGPACGEERSRQTTRAARALPPKERVTDFTTPLPDDRTRAEGEPWPVMAAQGGHDRNLFCKRYEECLDVAVRLRWPGFSCADCGIRGTCDVAPEPPRGASAAQMAIDAAPDMRGLGLTIAETKRSSLNDGRGGWRRHGR